METARWPGLLCLASFAVRIGFTVSVLALLARGGWELVAAALVGFVAVRSLGFRRVRKAAEASRPEGKAA
jgi:F1F0 ATPase subunit 2